MVINKHEKAVRQFDDELYAFRGDLATNLTYAKVVAGFEEVMAGSEILTDKTLREFKNVAEYYDISDELLVEILRYKIVDDIEVPLKRSIYNFDDAVNMGDSQSISILNLETAYDGVADEYGGMLQSLQDLVFEYTALQKETKKDDFPEKLTPNINEFGKDLGSIAKSILSIMEEVPRLALRIEKFLELGYENNDLRTVQGFLNSFA